jgi:hypothetical protein
LSVVKRMDGLDNSSVDLSGSSVASDVPCGPGFLVAVVYFKANGSYAEFTSLSVEVECESEVDLRFDCFALIA